MKTLNKLLMPVLASVALMGQAPVQQTQEAKSSVQMEYSGCVYIMSPLERQSEIKPLPKEITERFIKVAKSNELFSYEGKGYLYYGALLHANNREGKMAIGGFDLDIIHPGIADTQFVDSDWDGIPNSFSYITYPAWRYTGYKQFDELSKQEQFGLTKRFQQIVTDVANSTSEIHPLPKDVMERFEAKLDARDSGKRTEYSFYDGTTLSGLKSSNRSPWITLVEDNRGTNLYKEYMDKDKNGVPKIVYYNRSDCNDCVSEKEVASMLQGERDSTILGFQHMVYFVADSTGDSSRSLLPPLENVQGSIRQLYYDTYYGTVGPDPRAFQITFDSSGNQVNIPLRGQGLADMLPVEEIKGEPYIHLYVESDPHPDSVAKTLNEFDKLRYDKRGFWGKSWFMTIPLRTLPELSKISTVKNIHEADMSPMEPASH